MSGMFLTRDDIAKLPPEAFVSVYTLKLAIWQTYSVGVSEETAARILEDRKQP